MRLFSFFCTATSIILAVPASASDQRLYATYKGIIAQGTDQRGLFIDHEHSLAGMPFKVVFRFNGKTPQFVSYFGDENGWSLFKSSINSDIFLDSYVYINGKRFNIKSRDAIDREHIWSYETQFVNYNSGSLIEHDSLYLLQTDSVLLEDYVDMFMCGTADSIPIGGYAPPLFMKPIVPGCGYGYFYSLVERYENGKLVEEIRTSVIFESSSLTIRSVIPEISLWFMNIIGFGIVGFYLRRRQKSFDILNAR